MHGYVKGRMIGRADRRAKHSDLQGTKKDNESMRKGGDEEHSITAFAVL